MPRDRPRQSETSITLKQNQTKGKSYSSYESECYYVAALKLCLFDIFLSACGVEFPLPFVATI